MPKPILLREFCRGDQIPPVTELLHEAYAGLAEMGFRYLATHQDDAMTRKRLESGRSFFAEIDGELVGTVTLRPPNQGSDCRWYRGEGVYSFSQFGVKPDLQRSGIGSLLLNHVEKEARAMGAVELALDTAECATHLRNWYSKLGYRLVEYGDWEVTNYRSVVLSKKLDPKD